MIPSPSTSTDHCSTASFLLPPSTYKLLRASQFLLTPPMERRKEVLETLKIAFFWFQAAGKKLAARVTSQFEHSTIPAIIDDDDLEKLRAKVDRIRAALESADQLPVSDAFAQLWMRELRDLLHRAEDVLEDIEFESVQIPRLEEFSYELVDMSNGKRKRDEVSLLFYSFPRESISAKIDRIMETYAEIASDRVALRLDDERQTEISQPPASSSLTMGKLYCREDEFLEIRRLLLIEEDSLDRSYSVISLMGMLGIGKTAIVQHLCDDKLIKGLFKHRFWICASQGFDAQEITKTMLSQFGELSGKNDLNSLQCALIPHLTDNRVLVVIDDVWIGNRRNKLPLLKSHWESLQALLNHAGKGSKVIVTTQDNEIAKTIKSDHTVYLNGLSDEGCWEICKEKFFNGMHHTGHAILDSKFRDAIKKCKGLPLAAKAIGDFLCVIPKEQLVDTIKCLWSNEDFLSEIFLFLRVCYDRLPRHLRCCFMYCSLFPNNHIYEKHHLVRLWVGQGFVEHESYKDEHLEDVVGQYFDELVNRCLFQQLDVNENGAKRYIMHELLHQLAHLVASEQNMRIESYRLTEIDQKVNVRHSSLVPPHSDDENLVELELSREKYLHTFLFLGYMAAAKPHCINISGNIFWLIRSLRALDLSYTNITELPDSFNHLIHLRYLSLRKSKIEKLPESICGLFKLQTMNLKHCYALRELPHGIKHLVQLCHLELPKQKLINICVPSGIGKLPNLRKLPVFIVGNAPGTCGIEHLGDLKDLGDELHIIGLNHVPDEEKAKMAFLKKKEKLRRLKLQWSCSHGRSSNFNPESEFVVLEGLQPGEHLQELAVRGYSGIKFPKWFGDPCFNNLIKVNLKDCPSCEKLPSFGQLPLLKHLTVQLLVSVLNIGPEFYGRSGGGTKPFPALETLELRKMINLVEWRGGEEGDFPCLQNLVLGECKKLRLLPQFDSVKTLVVQSCEQLTHFPQMASLRRLNLEGFENMKNLPQLSNMSSLEKLQVVDCKQLSGILNIQCLVSLQQFNMVKCPALCISSDDMLPLTLEEIHIGVGCPMLSNWKPGWFEEVGSCDEGCRKLVRNCAIDFNNLVAHYNTDFVDSGLFARSNEEPKELLLPSLNLLH